MSAQTPASPRMTANRVQSKKGKEKIVCLTAYDYSSAIFADAAGVDVILVGDSLGNVIQGHSSTLSVTLEQMVYHTEIVARATQRALVVADMPFGSYQVSMGQAVDSAIQLMRAGAGAVKLEGPYYSEVQAILKAGIPVMAHIGMTPQSVHALGGFKVQGKTESEGDRLSAELQALQESGAFAVVLELIPSGLADRLTQETSMATIGIGAGPACDGQIQVFHDLLGITPHHLKHAKRYTEIGQTMQDAIATYVGEVKSSNFPTKDNSF